MLQQEINNLQVQLNEVLKQQDFIKTSFDKLRMTKKFDKVEKGAIVKTERGLFFISVSLGEVIFDNQKIICISPESPLAKAMNGKQKSDVFSLNNMSQKILIIE